MTSPSIWWNSREVLADEDAFSKRGRSGNLHVETKLCCQGGLRFEKSSKEDQLQTTGRSAPM
jgi:hypothetical protein